MKDNSIYYGDNHLMMMLLLIVFEVIVSLIGLPSASLITLPSASLPKPKSPIVEVAVRLPLPISAPSSSTSISSKPPWLPLGVVTGQKTALPPRKPPRIFTKPPGSTWQRNANYTQRRYTYETIYRIDPVSDHGNFPLCL